MSRSRRKSPITGNTTARSEKADKQIASRRLRHHVSQVLADVDLDHLPEVLPELREVSTPWLMEKDGKKMFDPKEHPRLMRK